MASEKPDVLLVGAKKPVMVKGLEPKVTLHYLADAKDPDAFIKSVGDKIRAIAIAYTANKLDAAFMQKFPKLEQISSFGVGYDHIDAKWAGAHGIVVTNTPKCSMRKWPIPRSASCSVRCASSRRPSVICAPASGRRRTIRSPRRRCATAPSALSAWAASARRSPGAWTPSACRWSITRATRRPGSLTKYYPKLIDMARDVDTLMVIVPGGPPPPT